MQKPNYGVLVARCQVDALHAGHRALFDEVRARHSKVILFLGQKSIGSTYNNPLDFETRKAMVQAAYPDFMIFPLTDTKEDATWSRNLDRAIRDVVDYGDVTLYGSRYSFVPHYHGAYKPIELTLPNTLDGISGTTIRAKITNTVMESPEFRAGVIYAMTNIRPAVKATVDVVIYHKPENDDTKTLFLLGRKPGETQWRFIGGFSEPYTPSYEYDAAREAMEETSLVVNEPQFIGSALIPDWRWKGEPDQIKSLVFAAESPSLNAIAGDDIEEVKWFPIDQMKAELLIDTHRESVFPVVYKHFGLYVWDTIEVGRMNVTYTHMTPKELAAEGLK